MNRPLRPEPTTPAATPKPGVAGSSPVAPVPAGKPKAPRVRGFCFPTGGPVGPRGGVRRTRASRPCRRSRLQLLADVTGVGPGTSLADKVKLAQTYVAASD